MQAFEGRTNSVQLRNILLGNILLRNILLRNILLGVGPHHQSAP